jgi:polyisoprenoid-binding protein YceI
MGRSKATVLATCILAAALATACDNPGARKGPPDAGRKTFAAGAVELRVDTAVSKVSLQVSGGLDKEASVSADFTLRGGMLALSNAAVPAARFLVDLSSFDSRLPIRNERVKQVFFETATPVGESVEIVVPRLPPDAIEKLKARKLVAATPVEAELTLHGRTSKITLTIDAGYSDRGALWIKTATPVLLNIADLGMTESKKKLMAVCQHERIDDVVKIDVAIELVPR